MLLSVVALVPIIWLVVAFAALKMPGHIACLSALVLAAVLALTLWQMPALDCVTSALEGVAAALWPIILVIIAAIFTYNLSLKTGAMDVLKRMLTSVSADRRVLVVLIGWCFGGFLEGMAGFGTAVAIPAGILVGLGMRPVPACLSCMLANAFPTAFGSVGIPTTTLVSVTGLDPVPLAFTTVVQMAPFMILVPFLMVVVGGGGLRALRGVVGITLASGVSFVAAELLVSYFVGPELTVIVGSVVSLSFVVALGWIRRGKAIPAQYNIREAAPGHDPAAAGITRPGMSPFTACLPFLLIFALLLVTSKIVPPVNGFLSQFSASFQISTSPNAGLTSFSWVNTPGVIIFVAAILGGIVQRAGGKLMWETFKATLRQLVKTILTIMSVLAVAKIMTYSGMIGDMANLFVTLTGRFYPFVAPIIAAIGAFVTGSGTNTEVLLGGLQAEAASAIDVSQYWLAAANSTGAGIGKILSPQCIATAVAAVGMTGQDSTLLKGIFKWAMLLLVIACLWVGWCVGLSPA